jgi:hypothetical protein
MDKKINVLDELNKGACMGMDAISFVIDKVNDKELEKELKIQYNKYKDISKKIKKLYPEYSDKKPHDTSAMNKVMTYYGIEMKLMSDSSSSHIAELLMQGTNMGIIEGRRLLNTKDINKDIHKLLKEYINMQEDAIEVLKTFL